MTETAVTHTNGRFAKGNIWRYRPGKSGHPPRYNYNSMRVALIEYATEQESSGKPLTWAGLARYLGMTRHGLDCYRDGKVQDSIGGKDAIVNLLTYYQTVMEEQAEARLQSKDYATAGLIFALKNQHGWRDEKHLVNSGSVERRISISFAPDHPLTQRLQQAGAVTVDMEQ